MLIFVFSFDFCGDSGCNVLTTCVWVCVQGSPKPLGRAFAEPEFKPVEQYYQKPRLRFYDISMGRAPAGELLAAFELIELDYSGFGEVMSMNQSSDGQICFNNEDKHQYP